MRGFLVFAQAAFDEQVAKYRHPNEAKLAKDLNDARIELAGMINQFIVRLLDFRSPEDVWIDIEATTKVGLVEQHGGHYILYQEDDDKRDLHTLELAKLLIVLKHLPQLKRAVIAAAIDHFHELKEVIHFFRENVAGVAGDEELIILGDEENGGDEIKRIDKSGESCS